MYSYIQTKNSFPLKLFILAPLSLALLAACGGGSSTGSSVQNPPAPSLLSSTLYAGSVSGLGSIVVNGVRFETVGARVLEADDPYGTAAYTEQIRLGMTVAVEGSADDNNGTGTASTIRIDGGMRGQVGAVDIAAGTLRVNGQTVKVDASTMMQGATGLAGIATTNWVEVYGLAQSDGSYLATRIEVYGSRGGLESSYPKASTFPVSLRGIVWTSASGSFTLHDGNNGTITVNYGAADVLPAGVGIAAGSSVRILANTAPDGNGAVLASKVLVLNPSNLSSANSALSYIKLKGVVDSVVGNTLVVSGTTVDISAAIKPAGAIAKNQVIEVKGTLSKGILLASKVEFDSRETLYTERQGGSSSNVGYKQELYGMISGFDAALNTFVVQGVTVQSNSATRFEYGYTKLANDVFVEVKGALQNGVLLASKIDVKGVTVNGSVGDSASKDDALGKSSGGSSFEIYGTLTCSTYPSACTINSSVNSVKTNLVAAQWEKGAYAANSYVEAKGYLDQSSVFQVTKIEVKR
ncbi:MAG: hypothetical protein HHJ09_11580 [Glaciimonas sp.]|nr:hypothetical protein [Glaciimonas sp.]